MVTRRTPHADLIVSRRCAPRSTFAQISLPISVNPTSNALLGALDFERTGLVGRIDRTGAGQRALRGRNVQALAADRDDGVGESYAGATDADGEADAPPGADVFVLHADNARLAAARAPRPASAIWQ